jgi:GNAT superfamily N-acetyltransferase
VTVVLRVAVPTDAAAGAAMHQACWREAYGPYADPDRLAERLADTERWLSAWTRQLAGGPPRVLAEDDGELVGFAVVGANRDPDAPCPTELYAIYVRAAHWGTGLGQQLWDAVRPEQACSLWVLETTAAPAPSTPATASCPTEPASSTTISARGRSG